VAACAEAESPSQPYGRIKGQRARPGALTDNEGSLAGYRIVETLKRQFSRATDGYPEKGMSGCLGSTLPHDALLAVRALDLQDELHILEIPRGCAADTEVLEGREREVRVLPPDRSAARERHARDQSSDVRPAGCER